MEGKIVAIMGHARAGKDTTAEYLVQKHYFTRIGLADPMKRFCKEVFQFSDEQLYGNDRDQPDKRYLQKCWVDGIGFENKKYLTPRYALQTLGTEWGRDCYNDIWIDYGIFMAKNLIQGYSRYDMKTGLEITEKDTGICPGVVFSDLRFQNEFDATKKAGAIMVRIHRPGVDSIAGVAGHQSEEEQKGIPDSAFDVVLQNDGTIEELHQKIEQVLMPVLR
jgi:hypothetical protein